MTLINPVTAPLLPLGISLLSVLWLSACAVFDLRTRHIPNWLTLPAVPLAGLSAWLVRGDQAQTLDEFLFHLLILTLPLFIAWRKNLLGGADLKILLVLSLADPLLLVAAWVGVLLYFLGLLVLRSSRPMHFAGVPGFALGAGLFTLGQLALFLTQHLAA
jgi:Flp pilus assembly protein protease CpaA